MATRSAGRTPTCIAVALAIAGLVMTGACTSEASDPASSSPDDAADPIEVVNTGAWPMHPIDGRYRGANGLGAADVDADGHTDYVTNYEFDQRWILELHPGTDDQDALRRSWPTVEIWAPDPLVQGNGKNPESAALGDFDGDGNVDAVGAHGFSDITNFEGSAPGVHVVWGPSRDRITDPDAWTDAGWVPSTESVGHPHWVAAHDVNGDGLIDVTVGGRMHGGGGGYDSPDSPNGNGTFTGLGWLEAPSDPAARRDLTQWELHHIDADEFSGHGFTFADLDSDGDDDVVDANADFDTPEDREEVAWYENPGSGTDAQRDEWVRRALLTAPSFYAKPSVAVGDLDADGRADIVTQTATELVLFRNTGGSPVGFESVRLPKPDEIAWLARPVRVADFDNDGDLDVFGMLIHDDNDLPAGKAAAFVLLNEGRPWDADGWRLLPVKWGSGVTMKVPGFGEKWDQVDVTDVDGDGDLDVVANCEEWWVEQKGEVVPFYTDGLATSSVAVVWFENTLGDPPATTVERDGVVEVEAERPTTIGDSTWVERAPVRDDQTGAVAVQALNAQPLAGGLSAPEATAGNTYALDLDGGRYSIWARVLAPSTFGPDLGGAASDSAWLVVDDGAPLVVGDAVPVDAWTWVRVADQVDLAAGRHELALRLRERGVAVDRIVLAQDPAFTP